MAPLPGFHQETLSDAVTQLVSWKGEAELYPSVAFALRMAHASLPHYPIKVRVNALLAGSYDVIMQQALQAVAEGYTCLKIKIGDKSVNEVVQLIKTLRGLIGKRVALRLDANNAFSYADAMALAERVAHFEIAFIEEPTSVGDLPLFCANSPVGCALDGSWRDEKIKHLPAQAYVIKPAMHALSGLEEGGKQHIVSSCFESSVGIAYLCQLASQMGVGQAHGLSTLAWFTQDIVSPPLRMHRGMLEIRGPLAIQWRQLRSITEWTMPL